MGRYVKVVVDPDRPLTASPGDPVRGVPPSEIVGDPKGALSDGSDATYGRAYSAFVFQEWVRGFLRPRRVTNDPDRGPLFAWVRAAASDGSLRVVLQPDGLVAEGHFEGVIPATATPEWFQVELTEHIEPTVPRPMVRLIEWLNDPESVDYEYELVLFTAAAAGTYADSYEAFITVPAGRSGAPPCRVFPADTAASVGGTVRQFPPSASRQRSSRGVGYY